MEFSSKKCSCETSNEIDAIALKNIVPEEYRYAQCDFKEIKSGQFVCRFRVNLFTKEDAMNWLEEFTRSSKMTFKKARTFPENSQSNVYKVVLRCHHNTRSPHSVKNPHAKHTNCPARMLLTVKQPLLTEKYRSKDIHLKEFPTNIILRCTHNHSIDSAAALKFRNPSTDVKETFLYMFESGYTPSRAYDVYIAAIQEEYGDSFHLVAGDRAICPDMQWVYYEYYQAFKKEYGKANGDKMLDSSKLEIELSSVPAQPSSPINTDEDMPSTSVACGGMNKCIEAKHNRQNEILEKLDEAFHAIKEKVKGNAHLLEAAEVFLRNFEKINSESALRSALHTFNKYSDLESRKEITTSQNSGVQPTSMVRRKTPCSGRLALQSGRPPKSSFTSEHSYSQQMQKPTLLPNKKRKITAPHNISECVEQNINLGKKQL